MLTRRALFAGVGMVLSPHLLNTFAFAARVGGMDHEVQEGHIVLEGAVSERGHTVGPVTLSLPVGSALLNWLVAQRGKVIAVVLEGD